MAGVDEFGVGGLGAGEEEVEAVAQRRLQRVQAGVEPGRRVVHEGDPEGRAEVVELALGVVELGGADAEVAAVFGAALAEPGGVDGGDPDSREADGGEVRRGE